MAGKSVLLVTAPGRFGTAGLAEEMASALGAPEGHGVAHGRGVGGPNARPFEHIAFENIVEDARNHP